MEQQVQPQPATLPKTIEEATRRYLYCYERNYNGPASDLYRLKAVAEGKIYLLRKKAPIFFEEKLPTLVNQAASALLTCDTSNEEGSKKFHTTHMHFIRILNELRRSQPAGEVNFQTEKYRSEERDKLIKKQLDLRIKIDQLEATEIDADELGEEEAETKYAKTFKMLDELKAEQKRVSLIIAHLEGEKVEEDPTFTLKVPPRSILNRLTKEQLKNLEEQMLNFYIENNKKKTALYVDKAIIDGMIEKLNIDRELFKKEELKDITKDALDAFKSYFRDIECERREEYFDTLLKNKHLLPKEGIIFESPDAVPEEVKQQLDQNERRYKREMDDIIEEYTKRPCQEGAQEDAVEESEEEDDTELILEIIREKNLNLARVKEEPRDDYDNDAPSDNEIALNGEIASTLIDDDVIHSADDDYDQASNCVKSEKNGSRNGYDSANCDGEITEGDNQHEEDDDDDEIECLGTIEPKDKIKTLELE